MKKKAYTTPATTVCANLTAGSFMENHSIGTDDKPASGEAGAKAFGNMDFDETPWTDFDATDTDLWQ